MNSFTEITKEIIGQSKQFLRENALQLGGLSAVAATLFTFNKLTDMRIRALENQEELREQQAVALLKQKLPLSVLRKYSLSK
ncbi:hypothetical protein TVAG_444410 [Trichomonas vaginalis G3]|uniref:Uncharacterized protein n=1 Tax=Trichomonas vaginalis (strain ATCC PRA-98 / G3) TaxID=412133 RepID=A2E2I2_TRIV3|nr:hypothetical protein TVAGG3_0306190 [Trichomonas vaginalis G3]EAY13157.1 hypothetical protein TVAG_444410 [Trichomonas vaginalis G3]KAI5528271.1 hypothetical protein TVAGG3_0306190 [Trichomonas vaginalis G3]|eukprot:XP_001325380.1 hypothetical protein [Trichomonas vaginalis G3]